MTASIPSGSVPKGIEAPQASPTRRAALSHTPFQWFGGKWEMAPWIASHLPRGQTLVLTHGGAGSPLWHVEPYPVEVYNDLDGALVNFFRVCREQPEELAALLELTPYSREEYHVCRKAIDDPSVGPVEWARRFATVARQSMAGATGRAWSSVVVHSRRGMASGVSRWLHLPQTVLELSNRLRVVQLENMDAAACIRRYDRPSTVFYCDPPYPDDVRQANVYRYEMALAEHGPFLDLLASCVGAVVVSGYAHPLYDDKLRAWRRVMRVVPCRSNVNNKGGTNGRPTRTEVLWIKDPQ